MLSVPLFPKAITITTFILFYCLLATNCAISSDSAEENKLVHNGTYTDPTVGMEFVWVEGGCFQREYYAEEKSTETTTISGETCVDGFWAGIYEVTNLQYRLYAPNHDSQKFKDASLNEDNQPVVNVSWDDANSYAEWQSAKNSNLFRLPTAAEWEFAARAGTMTRYYWGDKPEDACAYANIHDKTSKQVNELQWTNHNCDDGFAVSAKVGSLKANAFKLHDMFGNVWEWNSDWYSRDYYTSAPPKNPKGPQSGAEHVIRGGGWGSEPKFVHTALHLRRKAGRKQGNLGFRLIMPTLR